MSAVTKDKIKSLLQNARMEEAKILCQSFCKKNKYDAEAWFILGSIHGQTNEYDNAVNSLLKSISIQSNVAITHHNLGLIYLHVGKPGLARESFEAALKLDSGSNATRLELANALQADGAPDDAIPVYRSVLNSSPDFAPALENLASAYTATGKFAEAISSYKSLLKLQGSSAETLFKLGNAYRSAGNLCEAETTYRSVLQANPNLCGVLNNLGLTLYDQGLYADAEKCFRQSLRIEPRQSDSYINLAKCYQELRQTIAAIETLEVALKYHPKMPEIHWELSLVLLKLGQFDAGWREYEWRLQGGGMMYRSIPLPQWKGENIANQTILVTAEQGIGDEIMFSSCFQELADCASRVVIDCEERLAPLFRRSFPKCDIRPGKQSDNISQIGSLENIDTHIHMGSLPQYLRKHLSDFPSHQGYLSADPDKTRLWKDRYSTLEHNFNIGISWKGGHISKMKQRSASIKDWLPLLKSPGINFINLQYGDVLSDIDTASAISGITIHHWQDADPLKDMDNLAAQISALDLVISVDNSTVHMAGALGVRTWVLQPFNPDWRWMEYAQESYWYPSVLQFHQSEPAKWDNVMRAVQQEIANFLLKGAASIP